MSRCACVIGHPVSHSRSPLIHGYWLREYEIDGEYVREDVPPAAIGSFLDRLDERYVGANVTIPHKEAAFAKLKHPDPVARASASTAVVDNGFSAVPHRRHGFSPISTRFFRLGPAHRNRVGRAGGLPPYRIRCLSARRPVVIATAARHARSLAEPSAGSVAD